MSPLWRDECGIYLSPHQVCLVHLKRGVRPALGSEDQLPVEDVGASDWTGALEVLKRKMDSLQAVPNRLRVLLADHWVRYAVLPWHAELSSHSDSAEHARALLADLYGDVLRDWQVMLSDAPPGQSRVACAVPSTLLEALQALAARHRVQVGSIQPHLIAALNCWRDRLPRTPFWFVAIERGCLAAARVGLAGLDRVHTARIGADWARELRRLQTFGRLVGGVGEALPVLVDAPTSWRVLAADSIPEVQWLEDATLPMTTWHRLGHLRRQAA